MNNDVQRDATCCLFQFEGELRADHVEGVQDLFLASPSHEPRHVLVDCRRVSACDEEALQAMVGFEHTVQDTGGKLIVVGLNCPGLSRVVYLGSDEPTVPGGAC
ncbi:MAG TPA: STAS domain-containing protein [Oscillatoriaceae cyanobacterium]